MSLPFIVFLVIASACVEHTWTYTPPNPGEELTTWYEVRSLVHYSIKKAAQLFQHDVLDPMCNGTQETCSVLPHLKLHGINCPLMTKLCFWNPEHARKKYYFDEESY